MVRPLQVLLVDGSEPDAALIFQALERGGLRIQGRRVDTALDLRLALEGTTWDLLLTDFNLPGFDGLGVLDLLRETGLELPVIVLSGFLPEETAVQIMKSGAHDLVRKDHLALLTPAVERALNEATRRRERAQSEEALNTGNYRMKIILDSLVEGVAQYDRAGRLQAANASAKRFLPEVSLAELERLSLDGDGAPWAAGTHPLTLALKAGIPATQVVMGIRKDQGAPVWVSLNATPLLYPSREPWGVVLSFTDITEQRQVSRRREVVADLLQMAQRATDEAKLGEDMANRLALWSGCAAVGIQVQDGAGLRCHGTHGFPKNGPGGALPRAVIFSGHASRARAGKAEAAALKALARLGFEAVAFLPIHLGEDRLGLLQFLDPRPDCFADLPLASLEEVAGIAANILAKALAEKALRERAEALARSRAMLAQAQALAGLGTWELDLPKGSRQWSPETYLHWDCDPAEPVPTRNGLLRKVHPEDQDAFTAFQEALRLARYPLELEFRVITPSGATKHLFTQAIPLTGPSEPPGRIQGATMDITNRKQSEVALRDLDKLSAKAQMAAYIAHEINNPLAGIRNAFLLLEGAIPADHPHRSYVPLITREIDRIASIIRTMYHLYRPDPTSRRKVILDEVFHDLESLLAPKCRAHAATIAFDRTGMAVDGTVNEGLFRQVLFNLIQNAVEASPAGGVVTVEARSGLGRLEVSVADEGGGIAPDLAEHIFKAGFTTKIDKEISGLGLGLSTCRSLVETMGGTLAFQDRQEGPGTVFTVRLPFGDS
jgi:signal transduction histidine kinase/FixJ family two-component response regulator